MDDTTQDKKSETASPGESGSALRAGAGAPIPLLSEDDRQALSEAVRVLSWAEEQIQRLDRLFGYPAADESTDRERLTFIEVGGGSTHAKIPALTRSEIEALELTLKTILYARHATSRQKIADLSKKVVAAEGSK